jgi:hypothetical protein
LKIREPFAFIAVNQELVCEFFAVFARFEFALKESGYVHGVAGRASPDWKRYKVDCKLKMDTTDPLHAHIRYLLAHPPQVQDVNLKWSTVALKAATDEGKALEAIQRVRNNLFHGGKHPPLSPPGRDEELVKASLAVLYACLEQNEQLLRDYETTEF